MSLGNTRLSMRAFACALALLSCACAANRPAYRNDARGYLLIVGGGGTSKEMFERALASAGGASSHVVILPQASEAADTGAESARAWRRAGATDVEVLDLVNRERATKELREAQVIWFPGGVQTRLMKALSDAGLVELVRERYREGAVVGGTSAGAAVMSAKMITGDYDSGALVPPTPDGAAANAPANASEKTLNAPGAAPSQSSATVPGGATAPGGTAAVASNGADAPGQSGAGGRAPAGGGANARDRGDDEDSGLRYIRSDTNVFAEGLGLLPGVVVDQHFVRRQRFNRLLSALFDQPECIGIGIDEKTAILVHGTRFEVLGASNVVVVDTRGVSERVARKNEPAAIRDVELHVLRAGMTFDLAR